MRGRAVVRLLIVLAVVASTMLAPVVTWPSSGLSVDAQGSEFVATSGHVDGLVS